MFLAIGILSKSSTISIFSLTIISIKYYTDSNKNTVIPVLEYTSNVILDSVAS